MYVNLKHCGLSQELEKKIELAFEPKERLFSHQHHIANFEGQFKQKHAQILFEDFHCFFFFFSIKL